MVLALVAPPIACSCSGHGDQDSVCTTFCVGWWNPWTSACRKGTICWAPLCGIDSVLCKLQRMNQLEGNHGSRSRLDFRVNPCRQYLQKYLEGDFLRDLLASMAAGVVTLDLNPAGWISDAVSTSVGAWMEISDWDSWDSSAWRSGSGEPMERGIRGLGSDVAELGTAAGASGVQFLSGSLFGRKPHITISTIWLKDDEQFGIFPRYRYNEGIEILARCCLDQSAKPSLWWKVSWRKGIW